MSFVHGCGWNLRPRIHLYHSLQCDKSEKKQRLFRENARDVNKSLTFPHLILPFLCGRLEAKYT